MNRIAAAGVVLVLAGASAVILKPESSTAQAPAVSAVERPPAAISAAGMGLPDFRSIVRANSDAIVKLEVVSQRSQRGAMRGVDPNDPMFEFFRRFGMPQGEAPPAQSMGSGFIIGSDGKILTNAHVVEDATDIVVRLHDQREFKATVIGSDKSTDVAVIKIDASDLPTVTMGNSDEIEVGEWVLAIGSPFGLDFSATQGIISATGRELPGDRFVPFLQTDAAVNPGNSGGPLLNTRGEVIGINSQIYSRSGGYMGLSFAIPINTAMDVAGQLESKGFVERGWLGVGIQSLDPKLSKQFGLDRPTGALIGQVEPGSPADKSGLKAGDVVLTFNGKSIGGSGDLPPIVAATPVGKSVPVEVLREGKRRTITVTVGKLDESGDGVAASGESGGTLQSKPLDLGVVDLTDAQREELSVPKGGAVVQDAGSGAAAKAGIRPGDVILEVNRAPVANAAGLVEQLKKAGGNPLLYIQRGNQRIFLAIESE